jgi:hypothetical protein
MNYDNKLEYKLAELEKQVIELKQTMIKLIEHVQPVSFIGQYKRCKICCINTNNIDYSCLRINCPFIITSANITTEPASYLDLSKELA